MDISLKSGDIALNNQPLERVGRLSKELKQPQDDKKLKQACGDFEAVFVNMLFKEMRKTVSEGEFLGNSREEKIFREMLDEKLSDDLAKGGQLGIGKMLYNQLRSKIPVKTSVTKGERHDGKNL